MKRLSVCVLAVFVLTGSVLAYDNSPSNIIIFPECTWALATGGGTWVSQLQVTCLTDSNTVVAYFYYGGGSYRGPISLTVPAFAYGSVRYGNILSTLQSLDSGFTYYGRAGTLQLQTQDASHKIQAAVRTMNGNYSKTFQGLTWTASNWATTSQYMMIQNLDSNATYRTSVGFLCGSSSLTVTFAIIDANNSFAGTAWSRTFVPNEFVSFNPFAQAGVPYPTYSYSNCWLYIQPSSGGGYLYCYGASANNTTNDPAALVAVQFQ